MTMNVDDIVQVDVKSVIPKSTVKHKSLITF